MSRGADHVAQLRAAIDGFDVCAELADRWGQRLAVVLRGGGRLLAAGNGGSAAQAQHLTAELVGRYRDDRPPYSAICLSAETSSLTAIINDYPADELFARQVEAHGRAGDVLVLLSTSGRSPNVLAAASRARQCGMTVWAFTGAAPNPLASLAHEALCVPELEPATVQELHLVGLHVLCAGFDTALETRRDVAGQQPAAATSGGGAAPRELGPSRPATHHDPATAVSLVVVGDVLLDVDVLGRTTRLCPDAPVPVVDQTERLVRAGGAGLAATLATHDGADVTLIAPVAADEAGAQVAELLARSGVRLCALPHCGSTPVKTRIRCQDQSLLRLDSGGDGGEDGVVGDGGELPADVRTALDAADAVLVSDYGCGTTTTPWLRAALAALPARLPVVWDPHPRGAAPIPGVHLVTPNEAEATLWARRFGLPRTRAGLAATTAAAEVSLAGWRARAIAVTRGGAGALLSYGSGAPLVFPAADVEVVDACGAGDRFAVAAALALGAGQTPADAVRHAVLVASQFVAGGGAAAVARSSASIAHRPVDHVAGQPAGPRLDSQPGSAAHHVERVRAAGGVVVATGGCFDLLHAGHVATLHAARQLGDCLVVCLNSDASVRRLKGGTRPLSPAQDRRRVLEALECVDAVEMFDEDTPEQVLATLRPDIWAKGGDYSAADLPESAVLARWGGQAVTLPYVEGRSTTRLLSGFAALPSSGLSAGHGK